MLSGYRPAWLLLFGYILSRCIISSHLYYPCRLFTMSATVSISIWLDMEPFKLYVKLNDRMDNRDFHERFLHPLKVLGFRFDASRVAHGLDLTAPQECGLLLRQLDANFRVSPLEKTEILYWLGLDRPQQKPKGSGYNASGPTNHADTLEKTAHGYF